MLKKKKIIAILVVMVICLSSAITSYAKDITMNVNFNGRTIVMSSEDPNTTWTIDNFLPGDSDESNVSITNTGENPVEVDTDISIEEDSGLVAGINLEVTNSANEVVFTGSYTDFETIEKEMQPGESETYKIKTSLDVSAGNEYQGKQYTLKINFTSRATVPTGTLTIRYIDKDTEEDLEPSTIDTKEISEQFNLPETGKSFEGYKFVPPAEGALSGYYDVNGHTVTYKYEKIKYGKITVKYVCDDETESDGSPKILKQDSEIKEVGSPYSFIPETFVGYVYANHVDGNQNGYVEENDKEVVFHYNKVVEKDRGKVIIIYVDENGTELERKIDTNEVDMDYAYTSNQVVKAIPGYRFIEIEGNLTGKFKKEDTIIYCRYESIKKGRLIVVCVDENNNIIKRTVTTEEVGTDYNLGKVGDEIPGYEFLGVEGDTVGKYKIEDTMVIYRYQSIKSPIKTTEIVRAKTGDQVTKYIIIAVVAVIVIILLIIIMKKKDKDNK